MALVLQRLSPGVLSSAQINTMQEDIEAKFASAITAADMAWPFTAGGNFDLDYFQLLNVPQFWNVYNLSERDTGGGVTVQDVFDEVDAAGGGAIFLPPDTTETIGSDGVTVGSNTLVFGGGWSSIFSQTSAPTQPMFTNKAVNNENIWFVNLRLSGTSAASGATVGLKLNQVKGAVVSKVEFGGFRGGQLDIGADSAGSTSERVKVNKCHFEALNAGVSVSQLFIDEVNGVSVTDCDFDGHSVASIRINPVSASSVCQDLVIDNNRIAPASTSTLSAVYFLSHASAVVGYVQVTNNKINGGNAASLAQILVQNFDHVKCDGNLIYNCTSTTPAIRFANCSDFSVSGNNIHDYDGSGIIIGTDGVTGAGAAAEPCDYFHVSDNRIISGREGLIIRHGGTDPLYSTVSSNTIRASVASSGTYPAIAFWNCAAAATQRMWNVNMTGNNVVGGDEERGVRCFTDNGVTGGARIGQNTAIDPNFLLVGNSIDGTVLGNAGADDDFHDTADNSIGYVAANNWT